MAEGSASPGFDVDILSTVRSLQEQLKEQQKGQATILQQLSALQQGAISAASSTPGATGGFLLHRARQKLPVSLHYFPYVLSLSLSYLLGMLYHVEVAEPFSSEHIRLYIAIFVVVIEVTNSNYSAWCGCAMVVQPCWSICLPLLHSIGWSAQNTHSRVLISLLAIC